MPQVLEVDLTYLRGQELAEEVVEKRRFPVSLSIEFLVRAPHIAFSEFTQINAEAKRRPPNPRKTV